MSLKQIVLVAGVDYHFHGADFRGRADRRRKQLERRNDQRQDLRFTTMDVTRGEVEVRDVTYPDGKRAETKSTQRPFTAVTRSSYKKNEAGQRRFKPNQPTVMSITDVYKRICAIATNAPGTLIELSFFSHGWISGPILVDSDDDREYEVTWPTPEGPVIETRRIRGLAIRDPDDKDARTRLDFQDADVVALLKKAYHPDGLSWLWGCAFTASVHSMLTSMERSSGYRSSGVDDETIIALRGLSVDAIKVLDHNLAAIIGPTPTPHALVKLRFKYLRFALAQYNASGYAAALATATDKPVHAAPLGTYADFDTGGDGLMHVAPNMRKHLSFYTNYAGFAFGGEGRRYVVFTPKLRYAAPSPGGSP